MKFCFSISAALVHSQAVFVFGVCIPFLTWLVIVSLSVYPNDMVREPFASKKHPRYSPTAGAGALVGPGVSAEDGAGVLLGADVRIAVGMDDGAGVVLGAMLGVGVGMSSEEGAGVLLGAVVGVSLGMSSGKGAGVLLGDIVGVDTGKGVGSTGDGVDTTVGEGVEGDGEGGQSSLAS